MSWDQSQPPRWNPGGWSTDSWYSSGWKASFNDVSWGLGGWNSSDSFGGGGKDVEAPEFDGADMSFRQYQRRVENFAANTTSPQWRMAGRFMEELAGDVWDHCEILGDSVALQSSEGDDKLMAHLKSRFEVIENVRVGRELDDSIYEFSRPDRSEIREYDSLFRKHLARVECIVGPMGLVMKAHVFLGEANLPADKESKVVSGALNQYEYEALRGSMLASIPKVPTMGSNANRSGYHSIGRHGSTRQPHHRKPFRHGHRTHHSSDES